MEVAKSLKVHLRLTQTHRATHDRIQHPRRNENNISWAGLNVHELSRSTFLGVLAAESATIERVPPILNHRRQPDMGRMAVRSWSGGRITTARAPSAALRPRRSSTRCSRARSSPASILTTTCLRPPDARSPRQTPSRSPKTSPDRPPLRFSVIHSRHPLGVRRGLTMEGAQCA